jgi:hypothetical protein
VLATATTASDGTYSLSAVATGGKPLAAHWRITLNGFLPTLVYVVNGPHTKLMHSTLFNADTEDYLATSGGAAWDHANGIVRVLVFKCDSNAGIAGAQIAVVPGSTTTYTDGNGNPIVGGDGTSLPLSEGYDFNAPPGAVDVDLTTRGVTTTYPAKSLAGGLTYLIDSP